MKAHSLLFVAGAFALSAQAPLSSVQGQQARVTETAMLHLTVSDLDRSLEFYRDVLGMKIVRSTRPSDGKNISVWRDRSSEPRKLRVPQGEFEMLRVEMEGCDVEAAVSAHTGSGRAGLLRK